MKRIYYILIAVVAIIGIVFVMSVMKKPANHNYIDSRIDIVERDAINE